MALTKVSRGLLSTGIVDNSNATAITIDSSENVGIGTGSPNRNLHVSGGASDVAFGITNSASGTTASDGFSITVENPTTDVAIRQRENANMKFLTNNTERMRIDASGNVGIGGVPNSWSTVTNVLQMKDQTVLAEHAGTGYLSQNWYYNAGEKYIGNGYAVRQAISSVDGSWSLGNAANNTSGAGAGLSWQERMRIDSAGSLMVGGTAAGTVSGNNAMITVRRDSGNCGISYQSGTAATDQWETYSNLGARFYIENTSTSNGAYLVYNSSSGWVSVSDERWKTDWTSLEDSSSKIAALNVGKYHMLNNSKESIEGAKWDYGVKAQELLEVIPDAVDVPENPDDKYGVVPDIVFWHAVKAIQEQQTLIESLTTRIAALENGE